MRPRGVIVGNVSGERAPEMRLIEDDHMFETLSTNGSDQALDKGIGVSSRLHRHRAVRYTPFESPIPSIHSMAGRFS